MHACHCTERHDTKRVVLTGGPGAGKTAVLEFMRLAFCRHVVILPEGTGDSTKGALGIYRGQRGRMQIEVVVTGRSCHGSMPWEGLNPFEHGGAIVAEAARRYDAREGFLDHPFLGHGTRTASWAKLDTPGRIQGLAARHLALQPIVPTQFDNLDNLPERPPVAPAASADPIGAALAPLVPETTASVPGPR